MTLRDVLGIVRRRWLLVLLVVCTGISAGAILSVRAPVQYQATAEAYVSTQTAATTGDLAAAAAFSTQVVTTYAKLATTQYVLDDAATRLGGTTAARLQDQVTAAADQNSTLILVTATDTSPDRAARIANAVGAALSQAVPTLNPQSSNANSQVKITVVQSATAPAAPTGPSLPYFLVLGLLGGAVVAVGIVVLAEQNSTRLRSERDVDTVLRRPVLGTTHVDLEAVKRPLVMIEQPNGPDAEAFRSVRVPIDALIGERSVRSFTVTSTTAGDGKSGVAANLALALAQNGTSVVLVDADLRRPLLAAMFGVEATPGLAEVLSGAVPLDAALRPVAGSDVQLLTAGAAVDVPNELLRTEHVRAFVKALTSAFDVVILDTPPVLTVSDAAVVARVTDGVVIAATVGRTRRSDLGKARTTFQQADARVLGVVLATPNGRGADR